MQDALLANTQHQFISSILTKLNSQAKQLVNKDHMIDSLEIELQKLMLKDNNAADHLHSLCMQKQWIHKSVPGLHSNLS